MLTFCVNENPNEKTYNLIRNFLFRFLILNSYKFINMKIFIEVSSDYINFIEDYKILKLFKRHHIQLKNNPDFYKENKIDLKNKDFIKSFEVLNCLNLLKEGKINEQNFSFDLFLSYFLNFQSSSETYNKLIDEYFIKKYPSKDILLNFGQIIMFGELLYELISNLNDCKLFKPEILKEESNKIPVLKKIREKIVLSYIDFVIRFSSLNYEFILENQELASINQKTLGFSLTEQEKKELIEKLNKKPLVSSSQIDKFLVLFNEIHENDKKDYKNICSILFSKKDLEDYKELNEFYGYINS